MGFGAALGLFAAGAALYWAVEVDVPYFDDDALGAILMFAGAIALAVGVVAGARRASGGDGYAGGVGLLAAGAVLLWAVELDVPFVLDDALAVILMVAGAIALVATLAVQLQGSRSRRPVERSPYGRL